MTPTVATRPRDGHHGGHDHRPGDIGTGHAAIAGPDPGTGSARIDTERSGTIETETSARAEPARPPARPSPAVRLLVSALEFYRRFVSPLFLPHCRFHPSCSAYAVDALRTHGVTVGTGLTLVRLAKCGPWHPGGLDPVPAPGHRRTGRRAPTTEEQAL